MSKKNYRKENDGRSMRKTRLSSNEKLMMRAFPHEPRLNAELTAVNSLPLANLLECPLEFQQITSKEIGSPCVLSIVQNCYPEFIDVLAGNASDALLHPGVYIIHEVNSPNRVLYIGSAVDTAVRHRLFNHLCVRNKHGLLELVKDKFREILNQELRPQDPIEKLDDDLRTALYSGNRWTLKQKRGNATIELGQAQAIQAIETGAFSLAVIKMEESNRALIGLLEDFLLDASKRSGRQLPPLNTRNKCDRTKDLVRKQRGDIAPNDLLRLQSALWKATAKWD